MPRGYLFLLLPALTLAQTLPPDPYDRAMQAMQEARSQGNPAEVAARRDEVRRLLDQTPAGSPQWPGRVQNVAQLYQGSGRHADARAIVEDALTRASALPAWNPDRIRLLDTLAGFWQQDGNLLKAVAYREKAVAAFEATPPGSVVSQLAATAPQVSANRIVAAFRGNPILFPGPRYASGPGRTGNSTYLYEQLAALNRQLGRPEAAAKALAKMRALIQDDPTALASAYERDGDFEQARILLLKQAAAAAAKPQAPAWEAVGPLEEIASLYEREDHFAEAAATLQQAAARADASPQADAHVLALNVRQRLALTLQRSGQREAADQIYQALLTDSTGDPAVQQLPVMQQYANHLAQTGRAGQGLDMLKGYLANHADLDGWQQSNLLSTMAQIARQSGQPDLAAQYQSAAQEKQRAAQPPQSGNELMIGPRLEKAQAAANQGNLEESVSLALDAIASASAARDGDQIAWRIPSVAGMLAGKRAPDKADQLYRALFPVLEARSVDNVGQWQQALQQYARFLTNQKDRLGDAALAIDRYRESVTASQGAETNAMVPVQQLRIELARAKGAPEEAARAAEEMLALEESLSGDTSAPYLTTAQTVAEVFRGSGKTDRALPLYRQIAAIADLSIPANDARRGFVRMNAAMALASAGQFDEAERIAQEAIAAGDAMHPPRGEMFRSQAAQIQRMKAAAESGTAVPNGVIAPNGAIIVNGRVVTRGGWFQSAAPPSAGPRP